MGGRCCKWLRRWGVARSAAWPSARDEATEQVEPERNQDEDPPDAVTPDQPTLPRGADRAPLEGAVRGDRGCRPEHRTIAHRRELMPTSTCREQRGTRSVATGSHRHNSNSAPIRARARERAAARKEEKVGGGGGRKAGRKRARVQPASCHVVSYRRHFERSQQRRKRRALVLYKPNCFGREEDPDGRKYLTCA